MVTIVIMIMVIMATIMSVITLMIVTGPANAISVCCAEHLGYRGVAERCTIRAQISWHPRSDPPRVGGLLGEALPLP